MDVCSNTRQIDDAVVAPPKKKVCLFSFMANEDVEISGTTNMCDKELSEYLAQPTIDHSSDPL